MAATNAFFASRFLIKASFHPLRYLFLLAAANSLAVGM
jgi:hypothetical protein